jgi:hypothetical protein
LASRARSLLLTCALSFAVADRASAQDEQIIDDPELSEHPSASSSPRVTTTEAPAFVSEARLGLHSRLSLDYLHSDPREETWENTTIATLEATVRRSERLRFVVGMRARYHISFLSQDVPDETAQRVELDAAPTAGYVDIKLAEGANLQLGYQPVHLGRFELVSAIDVLSVGDFRDGPATVPEAVDVAQLGVRLDYDPTGSLSFRVLYVPFFTPHILSVSESDYALFRLTQAQAAAGFSSLGLDGSVLASNLSRADRERLAESGLAAFAPEANLRSQQAALRATLHGALGELSFSAATALEHLPAFYFSQEAIDYIRDPRTVEVAERFQRATRPIRVDYGRFALLALDGSMDLSPFSVGFEAAYMLHRTLYTLGTGTYPDTLPLPDTTDVVQIGARLEYVRGSQFLSTLEGFGAYAMSTPNTANRSWMFLENGRYIAGVVAAAAWQSEFGLRLGLGVLAMTGFTVILAPRVAYELFDGFEIELGSIIIEGPPPPLDVTPHIALGTLYDTTDQVFVGLSYAL